MDIFDQLHLFCIEQSIDCERNVLLKDHCTFKIGGPAALMTNPSSEEQIASLLKKADELDSPVLLLGKGSNMLFADDGYHGLVIHLGASYSGIRRLDDITIECDSGLSLASLCRYAQENALEGLEFAYGIPGSVGGAVFMNAGAYGGEIKDALAWTHHLDYQGVPGRWELPQLHMSYRHSAYMNTKLVLTRAVFRLKKGNPEAIRVRMDDYMNRRRTKQPLEMPSAGSTFKRPEGAYASALIDQCGLKGHRVGGAQVSSKHAGFIVNAGGATCADVLELIEQVRNVVLKNTGYLLECEVKVAG